MKTRNLATALSGRLRTGDLIALGVHTNALNALCEGGQVIELGRGLYRRTEMDEVEQPDLGVVAARVPTRLSA